MADDEGNQGAACASDEEYAHDCTNNTRHDHAADPLRDVAGTEPYGLCHNGQSQRWAPRAEKCCEFGQQEPAKENFFTDGRADPDTKKYV